jgi:hypothetical protein
MLSSGNPGSENKLVVWLFAGMLIGEVVLAFALVMLRA